jgi:hypothetical protein
MMVDLVKKTIEQIEKLPASKQLEIAQLIQDELSWESTFQHSQEELKILAKEAIKEYKAGSTSEENW